MAHLIDKDALVAVIERRRDLHYKYYMKNGVGSIAECKYDEDRDILSFIDTLEVKEVDLEEEIEKHLDGFLETPTKTYFRNSIKHFFELGLKAGTSITAADRGMAEEIITHLKRVENDYRIDLTREMEWLSNKVKKGENNG